MTESTLWWIIAGFCVSLELLSGSSYLLMMGLGAATAAISAMLGAAQWMQLLVATAVGGGAVLVWHRHLIKRGAIGIEDYTTTSLGYLEIGEEISVLDWAPDGTANVLCRGNEWIARHHGPHLPKSGQHRIKAIETSHLVLEPVF